MSSNFDSLHAALGIYHENRPVILFREGGGRRSAEPCDQDVNGVAVADYQDRSFGRGDQGNQLPRVPGII